MSISVLQIGGTFHVCLLIWHLSFVNRFTLNVTALIHLLVHGDRVKCLSVVGASTIPIYCFINSIAANELPLNWLRADCIVYMNFVNEDIAAFLARNSIKDRLRNLIKQNLRFLTGNAVSNDAPEGRFHIFFTATQKRVMSSALLLRFLLL
jgi:hypothetical protein